MNDEVTEYILPLQQYCVSELFSEGIDIPKEQINTYMHYRAEFMAQQLTSCLRVPADVVKDRSVIAEYPSTGWDVIKRSLRQRLGRLGKWIKYETTQHRLSEHIVYPQVIIPQMADKARIYIQNDITRERE